MASKIFISYRRQGFAAHAIYQRLIREFPVDSLFMDVEGLKPGDDFVEVLNERVEQCDVLLAIIGERWLDARGDDGNRRIDKEDDFVRIEIASALGLGKCVIPVLLNRAQMPGPGDLPPSLKDLAQRQAVVIRPENFASDTRRLIDAVKEGQKAQRELARKRLREQWEREFKEQQFRDSGLTLFVGVATAALLYVAYSLQADATPIGTAVITNLVLFVALVIALGFGFVNGFHDTANAVATVIYTHSLPARVAVVWSGAFNFLGVLVSAGGVAFSIMSLLPMELILQVSGTAGFAMVFALLIAALVWNLGTWYLGLPASSSHTLIGSIIGIGVANALMRGQDVVSALDLSQATGVGEALLLSPVAGFAAAALLLLFVRSAVRIPALYEEPQGRTPPPWWIRGLLILTCTGVSFAHGSNDGQKGMGLIMLILIGTVPTAYALDRALSPSQIAEFHAASDAAAAVIAKQAAGYDMLGDPRPTATRYVSRHQIEEGTYPALLVLVKEIGTHEEIITRKDMFLASEAVRLLMKDKENSLSRDEVAALDRYKRSLDNATKFIPDWVKITVALALGLGTMMGWKRIVVTVGEKIGKSHLSFAQGASAELIAAATVGAADLFSLPVSTTHVLSSGVAGTMAANGSGLQWITIRNIVLGWVLTLPVAIALSATLYWAFSQLILSRVF